MSKLICDFDAMGIQKEKLTSLVNEYNAILKYLISLEDSSNTVWKSEVQKVYYNKFQEKKADLEQLSVYYNEMIELLGTMLKTYEQIENNF